MSESKWARKMTRETLEGILFYVHDQFLLLPKLKTLQEKFIEETIQNLSLIHI